MSTSNQKDMVSVTSMGLLLLHQLSVCREREREGKKGEGQRLCGSMSRTQLCCDIIFDLFSANVHVVAGHNKSIYVWVTPYDTSTPAPLMRKGRKLSLIECNTNVD